MNSRLEYIDALRGWAILGVILTHCWSIHEFSGIVGSLASMGHHGVQLFFVISAFTIFFTLDKYVQTEHNPVRNFFVRRLVRIVPVYWFGIVLYTLVYGLGSRGWKIGPELWHYPLHIFLINDLFPTANNTVVPGGWSISCEILFYMTVPIWYFLIKSFKGAMIFCLLSMFIGQLIVFLIPIIFRLFGWGFTIELMDLYLYRSLFSQIGCFSFGILLYFTLKEGILNQILAINKSPYLLGGVAAIFILLGLKLHVRFNISDYILSCGFYLSALFLSIKPLFICVNKVTVFLGKISYSSYLVHFLVIKQITIFFPNSNISSVVYFAILAFCSVILTALLAWPLFRYLETPLIQYGKTWVKQLENKSIAN